MKINFVISNYGHGGQENVSIRLANELSKNNQVKIYSKFPKTFEGVLNPEVYVLSYKNSLELSFLLKNDVALFFGFGHKPFVLLLNKGLFLKGRYFLRLSININYTKKDNLKSLVNYYLSKITALLFEKIIVQNCEMLETIANNHELLLKRTLVINNPIPIDFFKTTIKHVDTTICFVGSLIKRKGINDLLLILDDLNDEINILIVGDGPESYKLINYAKDHPQKKIELIPNTYDVSSIYSKSTLLISPSFQEGSPNVLLEALAVGIPVVAYDCKTGPSEIIQQGVNGYLIPLGNIAEFVSKIKQALEQEWDVNVLKNSVVHHRADIVAKQYLDLFVEENS
jgi:glycosyltransferase involved in cell wall biosynthesis